VGGSHGRIDLSTAGHLLVKPTRGMPETSAILHQITDDMAARGLPLRVVLERLLAALAGTVLLAHNATFELQFLGAACTRVLGGRFLVPAVDTLELAGSATQWSGGAWESGAGAAARLSSDRASLPQGIPVAPFGARGRRARRRLSGQDILSVQGFPLCSRPGRQQGEWRTVST
jgi:hypothetical protein